MIGRRVFIAGLLAVFADEALAYSHRVPRRSRIRPRPRFGMPRPGLNEFILRQRLLPEITASTACASVLEENPDGRCLTVRRTLPSGDFVVTVRHGNAVKRVRVNRRTGAISH